MNMSLFRKHPVAFEEGTITPATVDAKLMTEYSSLQVPYFTIVAS